jgi:surface polysaccharide O-acyltransferase-like enzyme
MAATAFTPDLANFLAPSTNYVSTRNGSIDYLRFVGSIGIIWFHLHLPGSEIGLAALPMFVALFVCFGIERDMAALNRRLLYPWLVWSAIFGMAKVAQALISGRPVASEFDWWMLLAGPSIHLWFLPFSYLFVLLVSQLRRQARGAVVVVLVPCSMWLADLGLPQPFAQWVTVFPAACMGLVLNQLGLRSLRAHFLGWVSVAIAVLMVIAGRDAVVLQYAIGISAILTALSIQLPATMLGRVLSEASFGIYLLHPLVFALVLYLPLNGLGEQAVLVIGMSILLALLGLRVKPGLVQFTRSYLYDESARLRT